MLTSWSRGFHLASGLGCGLTLAGLLAGCTLRVSPVASLEGVAPGTTTLRVSNDLDSDGLERLAITIDGEPLPLSAVPPAGSRPTTVASLRLAPGAHAIAVRATARSHGEALVVVGQQPFWVTRGASSIGIKVRPSESGAAAPVSLDVTMIGGRLDASVDPGVDGRSVRALRDDRCASLMPIAGALCRTAIDLEEAGRRNDIVAALCLHDKLDEMRRLALIGDSGSPESVQLAEARVGLVARLAERCGGSVAAPAPDSVTVTRVP